MHYGVYFVMRTTTTQVVDKGVDQRMLKRRGRRVIQRGCLLHKVVFWDRPYLHLRSSWSPHEVSAEFLFQEDDSGGEYYEGADALRRMMENDVEEEPVTEEDLQEGRVSTNRLWDPDRRVICMGG